jgi:sugar/nucleoside kinase (ribokinase family)
VRGRPPASATAASVSIVGNVNVDVVVRPVTALPGPGSEVVVDHVGMRAAGSAGTTALALRALGLAPRLVGAVGDDALGRYLHDELRARGLERDVAPRPGGDTAVSLCFEAPARERSFLTALGVLASFGPDDVPAAALACDLVLLCGYFLLPALRGEGTARLLRAARAAGATTLLDTGWDPDGWPPATRAELLALLPLVDVFLPNEAEALGLTGADTVEGATAALQGASGGWVVTKLGARGCVAAGPGGRRLAAPAPAVAVTSTTGAGDAFNAGLLWARARGATWDDALRAAVALASEVVSRPEDDRYPRAVPGPGDAP